jgi:hypothetical protein
MATRAFTPDPSHVFLRSAFKDVPRWHRHDSGADPFGHELLMRLKREVDLAAQSVQVHLRFSSRSISEHIGPTGNADRGRVLNCDRLLQSCVSRGDCSRWGRGLQRLTRHDGSQITQRRRIHAGEILGEAEIQGPIQCYLGK